MTATKPKRPKPRVLPPYGVFIEDDDLHTYHYVIEVLQKVFGYSKEKSFKLAETIDVEGECLVWSGNKEVAELKVELIRSAGPDMYANRKVDFPLGCYMEPLP
jgi:ATP-dependent Clp protease adaptor protein ClpS